MRAKLRQEIPGWDRLPKEERDRIAAENRPLSDQKIREDDDPFGGGFDE